MLLFEWSDLDTPQFIGKYEILGRLGQGGMAEVFLARRTGAAGFEKKVALKRLGTGQVEDKLMIQSLINEARLVAQLSHQNLVQVLEFELIDNAYCMAMEYIDGVTLERVMDKSAAAGHYLPKGLILFAAQEICTGLDYAHSATTDEGQQLHLVHRDIKPSNIMISRRGQVKIMDFGIAKATTNAYKTTTHGGVKGTLAYMSPEQLSGEQNLMASSDMYSFGLILFELATLVRLYDDSNLFKLATDMQRGLTEEAENRLMSCFPELVPLVKRLLAFHPEDRYPDARSLLYDLRAIGMGASALEVAEYLKDMDSVGPSGASAPTIASGVSGQVISQLQFGTHPGTSGPISRTASGQPRLASTEALPSGAMEPLRLSSLRAGTDGRPSGAISQEKRPTQGGQLDGHPTGTGGGAGVPRETEADPDRRSYTRRHLVGAGAIGGVLSLVFLVWQGTEDSPASSASGQQAPAHETAPPSRVAAGIEQAPPVEAADPGAALVTPKSDTGAAPNGEDLRADPIPSAPATPAVPVAPKPKDKPHPARQPEKPAPVEPVIAAPVGVGTLVVSSKPYSSVFVDGKKQKEGPLRMTLPSGPHSVKLVAGDGSEKTFKVDISPGVTTERLWNFEEQKWME